jgi:hypothetical protein
MLNVAHNPSILNVIQLSVVVHPQQTKHPRKLSVGEY